MGMYNEEMNVALFFVFFLSDMHGRDLLIKSDFCCSHWNWK